MAVLPIVSVVIVGIVLIVGLHYFESWRERVGIYRRYTREEEAIATAHRIQQNLDRLDQS